MEKVIGTSINRLDSPDKATGKAKYTADYSAPDMLHVVLVRSEIAHGMLEELVLPEQEEGVFYYTAKDLKQNLIPSVMNDQPVLAEDHIRYMGEPLVVAAADTLEKAKKAAERVKVKISPLPLVDDMILALQQDAPKLFEQGNLCSEFHSTKGEPEEGFRQSAFILEDTFYVPVQCPGFLETESAFTYMDSKARLCLVSSTQNAFSDRVTLSQVLGIPMQAIHSKAAVVGGGFGGKDGNTAQIYPAIVTHFTGRPAKYIFSREENIRYGMKRHNGIITARMGFDDHGCIVAFKGEMRLDTGAYALLGPAVLGLGSEHMTGPYYIPNVQLDGWLSYTNHAPASAMRGFGAPQGAMAVESLLNLAAEKIGVSALEIRFRNAIHKGQEGPMGAVMEHSVGFEEALRKFEDSDFYKEMLDNQEENVGYGIAAGMMSSGMGKHVPDSAAVTIERTKRDCYRVHVGLVDIGQGSETVLAMIAA
ncbi:MAG: xanthine dehydrogenase family protein, partial [Blautia sp.]|nr:xanthine dehydrogenase family protein [Blautia sp.]